MLEGERVRLRALERDDLPTLWAFNNDLSVELAGGGDPPMPQALDRLVAEWEQKIASGGRDGTSFAIEADGEMIGHCALFNENHTARTGELGITIGDEAYWGRGYGRECVQLLLEYAFRHHNFRKVWLNVHAQNQRAVRSYSSCGFVEEGRLREHVWSDGAYDDLLMLGVLRDEWVSQNE
jgi:RimJ/RimL family protein N-acetyltransferase